MGKELTDFEVRKLVIAIAEPILDSDTLYRGKLAIGAVADLLGISDDEAFEYVDEFMQARRGNSFPGGVRELPTYNPNIAPAREMENFELHHRAATFVLGYVEHATERDTHGVLYEGKFWLSNGEEDTRAFVKHLAENPDQVVAYLRWGFEKDRVLEPTLRLFSRRAVKGKLRPPIFE